jgi:hypothetical protein
MARSHGKEQYLKLGTIVVSGAMNQINVVLGAAASDSTGFGADAEEVIAGLDSGSISASGFYDTTDASTIAAMRGTIVTFEYGPEGNASGKPKYSGSCLVTEVTQGGPLRDTLGRGISATVTGAVAVGTFSA